MAHHRVERYHHARGDLILAVDSENSIDYLELSLFYT